MRLPLELWKEVINEAGTIQDEFEPPPLFRSDWNQTQGALYLARWHKTFHIRLSLALVSRAWHSVALQPLYSSLVFERSSSLEQAVTRLAASNLARWVQRVTLLDEIEDQDLQRVLGYLPTLRFLQFSHVTLLHATISDFSSPCNHLTSLENVYLTAQSARALTQLPNLQHLQCRLALRSWTGDPVTLLRLHSLHISIGSVRLWTQFLVLPNLRTLRITNPSNSPACQDALATHLTTLHALASSPEYPLLPPFTTHLPAPHLRELLCQEAYWSFTGSLYWIPMNSVEIIYLPLEHDILRHIIKSQNQEAIMDRLSSALRVTREPSIPLILHTVCTDLTSNTLTVAGSRQWWESPICVLLKAWVEDLEGWNVQVLTRVYETVLDDPRQVPLAQVFDAAPNFEFWPPCLDNGEDIDRWTALACATGRHTMKWEVKNNGMECGWIGQES